MDDQPVEPSEREALEPNGTITVNAPLSLLPGSKSVALFFLTTKEGIQIELQLDGGGDTVDPRDPAHALAFYVQHNALQILPLAAMWFAHMAEDRKEPAQEAANDPPAVAVPRAEVALAQTAIVDAGGQPLATDKPAQT